MDTIDQLNATLDRAIGNPGYRRIVGHAVSELYTALADQDEQIESLSQEVTDLRRQLDRRIATNLGPHDPTAHTETR